MHVIQKINKELEKNSDAQKAKQHQHFFKTGKGEYGEGDIFIGITVPTLRKIAKKYQKELTLKDIQSFLSSPIHEKRLLSLFLLRIMYEQKNSEISKESIIDFYLSNTRNINNWDLVDSSASYILGHYLLNNDLVNKKILHKLADSNNLWEQRIAIISTHAFIKNGEYSEFFKLAEKLLHHEHDLIHKAIGWMLREVGKKNLEDEEKFLQKHYKKMPRTMLRYAIERFEEPKRKAYLSGHI